MKASARFVATFARSGASRSQGRAFATRDARNGSKGSGAPSTGRVGRTLAVLSLAVAAFAIAASPASAAPPTTEMGAVTEVSYASAHVTGKLNSTGEGAFGATTYIFQYSTDETNWVDGFTETLFGGALVDKFVKGDLSGLKGGTKYFVRLAAYNGSSFGGGSIESTSPKPNPSFTTLAVDPPSIPGTVAASSVFSTSATGAAKVKRPVNPDPTFDIKCRFEYVTDADFKATGFAGATVRDCLQNPIDKADANVEKEVTAPLGCTSPVTEAADGKCLSPGTTYHLRLVAENASPTVVTKEATSTFTALPPVAKPTVVAVEDATEPGLHTAKAAGEVERPAGADPALDVSCRFEYVTDAQFNVTGFAGAGQALCLGHNEVQSLTIAATAGQFRLTFDGQTTTDLPFNAAAGQVRNALEDLGIYNVSVEGGPGDGAGSTPYRITFINGFAEKDVAQIVPTDGTTPLAGTASVTTLTGGATPFEAVNGPPTNQAKDIATTLTGLSAGTVYHLRLTVENGGGTDTKVAVGTVKTVTVIPPSVTVDSITDVGYQRARVTATADPGNQGLYYGIEYAIVGTEDWSGFEFLAGVPVGSPPQQFSKPLGPLGCRWAYPVQPDAICTSLPPGGYEQMGPGLKPGTTYKLRGDFMDTDEFKEHSSPAPYPEFTTLGTNTPPSVTFDPVGPITGTTAHFNAVIDTHAPAGPLPDEAKDTYRTDWHFECTPECPPNADLSGVVEAEEGSKAISVDAIRLEPNTPYEVKLIAHNQLETVETTRTFKTPLIPPTVKSSPGGSDGNGGYILEGVVNPNNSLVTNCKFEWGPNLPYAFSAPCSPTPGDKAKGVTVEAHLTGLTPEAVYHAKLVATNSGGSADSGDFTFIPTLDPKEECANDQQRKENSSLALPECRAYEQVSDPSKEGSDAELKLFAGDDTVLYGSTAANIANSGSAMLVPNSYTTIRSSTGWETVANLNGPTGSQYTGEEGNTGEGFPMPFSADLRSSLWTIIPKGAKAVLPDGTLERAPFLRKLDGSFALVGHTLNGFVDGAPMASDDLNHIIYNGLNGSGYTFGPGVYEFVGTGNGLPDRVDIDNSGDPVSCESREKAISVDGRVIVFSANGGCGSPNPPSNELWARVGGTTSFLLSASQCTRTSDDPGGTCNSPVSGPECGSSGSYGERVESGSDCRGAAFVAAARDGSRVFFTTNQQLLNGDTDQTSDLYACDIPSGPVTPTGAANPCSALRQVSGGYPAGADVQRVSGTSEDGSSAYFVARGVLADNEDAFGNKAKFGDHNLYVWRTDTAHPDGQTTFVARLADPMSSLWDSANQVPGYISPDGRYLTFIGTDRLTLTDNDDSYDVYRYDAETGELVRVSTNVSGTGGNGAFDARSYGISDDGQKIVFITIEGLSPVDGNEEPDAYLWSASTGRVYLISSGSVGGGISSSLGGGGAAISPSGKNVYFNTRQVLTPSDIDNSMDVYSARIGGGFSLAQQKTSCSGEGCQPPSAGPPAVPAPAPPNPQGNVMPKLCPKGKVAKGEKCVKKPKKKHSKKKAKGHGKQASHNRGGSK